MIIWGVVWGVGMVDRGVDRKSGERSKSLSVRLSEKWYKRNLIWCAEKKKARLAKTAIRRHRQTA